MKLLDKKLQTHYLVSAILTSCLIPYASAEINFSGFISIEGGLVDDEFSDRYKGYSEEDITFSHNTIGLQMSSEVSENITATAQFIARGENNYAIDAEWGYLTWQASKNTRVRIGRMGTPFYMFSDFRDVGYAYAWISAPEEVYYIPVNQYDGLNIYHNLALGNFDATIEGYFGGYDDTFELIGAAEPLTVSTSTRNQMGVAATLGKDWWSIRAAYHQAKLTNDVGIIPIDENGTTISDFAALLTANGFEENANSLLNIEDDTTFIELGYNIDTGRFVSVAEYIEFHVKDSMFSKDVRGYVMAGLRFGDWLFHITRSGSRDEQSTPEQGIPDIAQTAAFIGGIQAITNLQTEHRDVWTLGTRWDLSPGTALKFQVDSLKSIDVSSNDKTTQKVFSVALQTVF